MPDSTIAAAGRTGGWTVETYAIYNDALRAAEVKFQEERDRRYAEVATEREKALKIKETADLAALGLAREIQTYKDEKANQLREQINSERGHYATKDDLGAAVQKIEAQIGPVLAFVSRAQGQGAGAADQRSLLTWALGILLAIMSMYALSQSRSQSPVYVSPPATTVTPPPVAK